jgi:hypothetical protein
MFQASLSCTVRSCLKKQTTTKTHKKNPTKQEHPSASACSSSHLGSWDLENWGLRPIWANNLETPSPNYQSKVGWRCGSQTKKLKNPISNKTKIEAFGKNFDKILNSHNINSL